MPRRKHSTPHSHSYLGMDCVQSRSVPLAIGKRVRTHGMRVPTRTHVLMVPTRTHGMKVPTVIIRERELLLAGEEVFSQARALLFKSIKVRQILAEDEESCAKSPPLFLVCMRACKSANEGGVRVRGRACVCTRVRPCPRACSARRRASLCAHAFLLVVFPHAMISVSCPQ
eukprot:6172064-Pleurochrysis_carterae.AAC.2